MLKAIKKGDLKKVDELMHTKPINLDKIDTYMSAASRAGLLDIVEYFFNRGATSFNRSTMVAAENGHADIVYFFLDNGPYPEMHLGYAKSSFTLDPQVIDLINAFIYGDQDRLRHYRALAAYNKMRSRLGLLNKKYLQKRAPYKMNLPDVLADNILSYLSFGRKKRRRRSRKKSKKRRRSKKIVK